MHLGICPDVLGVGGRDPGCRRRTPRCDPQREGPGETGAFYRGLPTRGSARFDRLEHEQRKREDDQGEHEHGETEHLSLLGNGLRSSEPCWMSVSVGGCSADSDPWVRRCPPLTAMPAAWEVCNFD